MKGRKKGKGKRERHAMMEGRNRNGDYAFRQVRCPFGYRKRAFPEALSGPSRAVRATTDSESESKTILGGLARLERCSVYFQVGGCSTGRTSIEYRFSRELATRYGTWTNQYVADRILRSQGNYKHDDYD